MKKYRVEVGDDGTVIWFKFGTNELHREDGPAIVCANRTKTWYLNGKYHRDDGPAIERHDGTKQWFLNGKPHREDGPAFEWSNGDKEYWIHGKELTKEQFLARQNPPSCDGKIVEIDGKQYKLSEVN